MIFLSITTKLIFEVYRFAVPTSLVLLCTWRWANADIDPTLSERNWYIKLLFAIVGYVTAFVTGASYLVHDSRVTPAGMLADMAKDPLPDGASTASPAASPPGRPESLRCESPLRSRGVRQLSGSDAQHRDRGFPVV